jgi:hypothetical protein
VLGEAAAEAMAARFLPAPTRDERAMESDEDGDTDIGSAEEAR